MDNRIIDLDLDNLKLPEFFKKNKYSDGYIKNVIVDWIFNFMEDGEFDNIVIKEARYFLYELL